MLARIEAAGFRCLWHVEQELSPFQLLVGPNGSGKSTFLDVIAFIGDLLKVGPFRAIAGDAATGVPSRAADPLSLCWGRKFGVFELALEMVKATPSGGVGDSADTRLRYEVAVSAGDNGSSVGLTEENLHLLTMYSPVASRSSTPKVDELFGELFRPFIADAKAPGRRILHKTETSDYFRDEITDWNTSFKLGPGKSALASLPEDETRFPAATWAKRLLMQGIQRVVLSAETMRRPSPPGQTERFQTDGSNLPWVIERLSHDAPDQFARWIEHVRTALPDLEAVRTIERPEDRHRYLVIEHEGGAEVPSWGVSDGTLRLLALTLLAYIPHDGEIYLIEEPENGIHPRAVETVYQSLSSVYDAQILCASHSPVLLSLARPEDLLCFRKEDGATLITRGDEHPQLRDWKGTLDLGTLFAAGVLE